MNDANCPVCGEAGPEGDRCGGRDCKGARFTMSARGRAPDATRVDLHAIDEPEWYESARAPIASPARSARRPAATRPRRTGLVVAVVVGCLALVGVGVATLTGGDDEASGASLAQGPAATAPLPTPIPIPIPVPPPAAAAKAPAPLNTQPPLPRQPTWSDTLARSNRWIDVPPARSAVALGLARAAVRTAEERQSTTGFMPTRGVLAPTIGFAMQEHEVTWSELERYLTVAHRSAPVRPAWVPDDRDARARLPASGVPWALARAMCQALGGDLPSERQWEWAARGGEPSLRTYPWGEALPFAARVHFRRGDDRPLYPVKTADQDVTSGGIADLLGNAREWTRDAWMSRRLGAIADNSQRAVRGWPLGGPGSALPHEGATYRAAMCGGDDCAQPELELVGFRCVRPLAP